MAKNRLRKPDRDAIPTLDDQIDRLIAANAQVQADIGERLGEREEESGPADLLKAIISQLPAEIFAKDAKGRFIAASDAVAHANGLERSQDLIGKTDFDLFPAEVAQGFHEIEQKIIASGQPMMDVEVVSDDKGATEWHLNSKVPLKDDRGRTIGLIGIVKDITELRRAEQDWKVERALFRAMINQVPDYLFVKDTESRFVIVNRAVAADLGLQPDDLMGKTDFALHQPELARKFFADEQRVIATGEPLLDIDEYVVDPSGVKKWLSTSKVPLRNEQNQIVGIVGISRNVTDRKSAEEQIRFMALHDALTKLPNRTLLMDRLAQIILHAERDRGHVTVIFIDLDNFKLVNDSLGHNAGDTLLKTVAERMVACVRATDTVARLGGDEFVVLLADHGGQQSFPTALLEKLRAAIAEPIPIEGQQFHVTSSIGVATFPEDGADADALVMNADVAMYEAKQKGRDNYQFYTGEMNEAARERRLLQEGLRGAIVNKEFVLAYQPQVDLHTGAIFAVEALVRWRHPMFGMVPPAKFIPLAEESGLIVPLGDWVMREACRQNKAWQDAGIPPITMCVNVSARQFRDRSWVARVTDVLRETGMDPNYLELELTESMLMHDVDTAIDTMRQLQATRRAIFHRRFRYRIFEPERAQELSRGPAEDRPVLRAQPARRRQ